MRTMYSFGPFELDADRRILRKSGAPVRLTLKCVELLVAFARNPGKTLTKEDLLHAAWRDPEASDATLAQHVFLLRRALKHEGRAWIETVPQIGYRFTADVAGGHDGARGSADEFMEGADSFRALSTEQGLRSAIDLYTRALHLEERNAAAYARRACCWRLLAEYMYADPQTCLTSAKADAALAVTHDPNLVEARIEAAHAAALLDRDLSAAARHLDAAHRAEPNNPSVRFMRVWLPLMRGNVAAALSASRGHGGALAGAALYFARAYKQALAHFDVIAPDNPAARVMRGACKFFTGDTDGAIDDFRSVYREHVDVRREGRVNVRHYALALLIFALAKTDRIRARRAVADLAALARQRYVSPMARAIAHIGLGETDVAMAFLEEAVARFDPWAAYIAVDPFLDAVRDDPRFTDLVGRLAA